MFFNEEIGVYDGDLQDGDREATQQEIEFHISNIEKDINKQNILSKISQLENDQLRPLRELEVARLLGETNDFAKEKVISINSQIAELRKQLQ